MNKIITTHVLYRGQSISVDALKNESQIVVEVECNHGRRSIRWSRRNNLCKKCAIEKGVFNTSSKGRKITWGDKISKAKKGVKFSDEHKKALIDIRKQKIAKKINCNVDEVIFPTKGKQFRLRIFAMNAIKRNIIKYTIDESDSLILNTLGYSISELKSRLEALFQPGMTWDNYGEWHIDHIRPDSWFKYESTHDQSFKDCWSLNNLQPLWARDNIKKGNKYEGLYREPSFYMLCGQSGVGKTTLLKKMHDKFNVITYDLLKNKKELDFILRNQWYENKPLILDIPLNISTTIKEYSGTYKITKIFLIEPIDIVKSNIAKRGGRMGGVERRFNRIKNLSKRYGDFVGNAREVESYLRDRM